MKFLKKNLPALAVAAGIGATIITTTAVYFSTGTIPTIVEQRRYALRQNKPLVIDGYFFDTSFSFGSVNSKTPNSIMNANLIRMEAWGETEFEKDEKTGISRVVKPSNSKLIFENGSAIIFGYTSLKPTEGEEEKFIRFDSDDIKGWKPPVAGSRKFRPSEPVSSTNPRSINSNEFKDLTTKSKWNNEVVRITSINVAIKKEARWVKSNGKIAVDSKGNEYEVKPDDFYFSFMRTKLLDRHYRTDDPSLTGGSVELDTYFAKKSKTTTRFNKKDKFQNEYLFDFFGVDSEKLADRKSAVRDTSLLENKKFKETALNAETDYMDSTFTLVANKDASGIKASGILNKMLLNSNLFAAAPSEYIESIAKNDKLNKTTLAETPEIPKNSLVRNFGIYTYGVHREDVLFAGPYIPKSAEDNKLVLQINKHFARQELVKDETVIREFIFEYMPKEMDQATYNDQVFNNFSNKTLSEMSFSTLSAAQRKEIWGSTGKDYKKNGLLFTKELLNEKLVNRTIPVSNPASCNDPTHFDEFGNHKKDIACSPKYNFNNAYAEVVYGNSLDELWKGSAKTTDTYYDGSGFKLRTYINAATNWYTFIQGATGGTKVAWINNAAPDSVYSDIVPNLSPVKDSETTNSLAYVNEKGELVELTMEQMKQHWIQNQSDETIQFRTPYFDAIKPLVKKVIDEALTKAKLDINSKLTWVIWYPYRGKNDIVVENMKKVVEHVIKALDPRLVPEVKEPKEEEFSSAILQDESVTQFGGWTYDYDGLGSYLDGITHYNGYNALGFIGKLSNVKKEDSLAQRFPNIWVLSQCAKKYFNQDKFKNFFLRHPELGIQNWENLTNKQLLNLEDIFKELSVGKNTKNPSKEQTEVEITYVGAPEKNPNDINEKTPWEILKAAAGASDVKTLVDWINNNLSDPKIEALFKAVKSTDKKEIVKGAFKVKKAKVIGENLRINLENNGNYFNSNNPTTWINFKDGTEIKPNEEAISLNVELSKFFFEFQNDEFWTKPENNIYIEESPGSKTYKWNEKSKYGYNKLIYEFSLIQGPALNADVSIIDPESVGLTMVQNEYIYPTQFGPSLYLHDIRLPKKGDK